MKKTLLFLCLGLLMTSTAHAGPLQNALNQKIGGASAMIKNTGISLKGTICGIAGSIPSRITSLSRNNYTRAQTSITGTLSGMIDGFRNFLFPSAKPAAVQPPTTTPVDVDKPEMTLSEVIITSPGNCGEIWRKRGSFYKNGSVILTYVDDVVGGQPKEHVTGKGTIQGDVITMDNGDKGMLNRSSRQAIIGTKIYH